MSSPTVLSDPLQDIPDQLDVSDSVLLISSPPPISPNYSSLAVVHSSPLLLPHSSSTPLSSPQSSFVMNPLVAAGLVNPDLADIPATPPNNAAVTKQRVKRIVGARDLTSNEYTEMLRADKKIEEEKKRKKEARESKKKEMEEKKKLKLLRGRGRGRGRRGGRKGK